MFHFSSLEKFSIEELKNVFNKAFDEYIIPLQFTTEQLEAKFYSEEIDLTLSVGVCVEGELVGFIFHFRHVESPMVLYNGGTGVVSNFRGYQLTEKMYDYFFNHLCPDEVREIKLEVISCNQKAIQVYKKIGFLTERTLNCYRLNIEQLYTKRENRGEVKELNEGSWIENEKFLSYLPTWQYSSVTISRLNVSVLCLGLFHNNIQIGILVINNSNNRILQFGVKKEFSNPEMYCSLLSSLVDYKITEVSMINLEENSILDLFFKRDNDVFLQQMEMRFIL